MASTAPRDRPADGTEPTGQAQPVQPAPHLARGGSQPDPIPAAAPWWRSAAIGAAALALALGLLAAVWLFARTLALLFAAVAIAEALAPLVGRQERRLPRTLAVVLVYLALVLAVAGLGWVMVPRLVAQAQELAAHAPGLVARAQEQIDRWDPAGQQLIAAAVESTVGRFSGALLAVPFTIVSSLAQIVLVLFMALYWTLSAPKLRRFVLSLVPEQRHARVEAVLGEVGGSVGGYVRGQAIDALAVGVATYVGLLVIGIDYPLVLALIAGLAELVPVVGPIVSAVPAVAVALLDSPGQALVVLAFFVVLQQVESNILVPHTMDKQADVPPLLALVALFAGAGVGGLLGALVAIPLAGALKVLVLRVAAPALRQWSGAGAPARPNG